MKKTSIGIAAAVIAAFSATVPAEPSLPVGTACIAPGPSDDGARPAVQQVGSLRLVTGGIGIDEARAMRQVEPEYPLALTFVQQFGQKNRYLSAVQVEIHRASGESVLCATSDGPFMYVDLPPGEYHVVATTDGGRMLERKATLDRGDHREMTFVWPASASAR